MDTLDNLAQIVPVKYQVAALAGTMALKWLAELYSTIRNGGGLKRVLMSFWFGEQTPKVIANDYKEELATKSIIPPTSPTL